MVLSEMYFAIQMFMMLPGNMPTTHMVPGKPTGVRPPPNIAYIHGARPMMRCVPVAISFIVIQVMVRPRPMPTDGAPVKGEICPRTNLD